MNMSLTELQKSRFQDYNKREKLIFSNEIVSSFFQKEENVIYFLRAIDGEIDYQQQLNESFRKHFFRIRFIKYMVSTIHYCAIDQMRRSHKKSKKDLLIFDHPVSDNENSTTFGDLILGRQAIYSNEIMNPDPSNFIGSINNEKLEKAFFNLSPKQQLIITYSYGWGYKDFEISRKLGVTQQAVSKARNLALKKLRVAVQERELG